MVYTRFTIFTKKVGYIKYLRQPIKILLSNNTMPESMKLLFFILHLFIQYWQRVNLIRVFSGLLKLDNSSKTRQLKKTRRLKKKLDSSTSSISSLTRIIRLGSNAISIVCTAYIHGKKVKIFLLRVRSNLLFSKFKKTFDFKRNLRVGKLSTQRSMSLMATVHLFIFLIIVKLMMMAAVRSKKNWQFFLVNFQKKT